MRNSIRSIGLLAVIAIGAASAAFIAAAETVGRCCRYALGVLSSVAVKVITGPEPVEAKQPTASLRGFVVHREHQRRQVKRQAPRIEDSWRMCPSV